MKTLLIFASVVAVLFILKRLLSGTTITPAEAARRVKAGHALLIDVREPDEWREGVVSGALCLSLSDLRGQRVQWTPILDANRDKELICYCRAGTRAGMVARLLTGEGFKTANAGGYAAWQAARLA